MSVVVATRGCEAVGEIPLARNVGRVEDTGPTSCHQVAVNSLNANNSPSTHPIVHLKSTKEA